VGGCGLSRHQCGFAWIKGDCTRLAGEGRGEAAAAVVGWRVVWCWWCWVDSRSSSSSHGQKCGLAGSLSLWGHRQRLARAERKTTSDNTRRIELNRK
jgi:hypothetical protein